MAIFNFKKNSSREKQQITNIMQSTSTDLKDLLNNVPSLIKNHKQKPKDERSKDIKALFLTLAIVSIIILAFVKIPFLQKLVFP